LERRWVTTFGGLRPRKYAAKVATLLGAQDLQSFLNYQNKSTFTALHAATANNDLDVTRLLIEAGCNVNVTTDFGRTPLMTVAQNGYTSIAKELIAARCNVDLPQHDGATPFPSLHRFPSQVSIASRAM
jgi:ankyrin repeat protein